MLGSENDVNKGGFMFTFETTDQKEVRRFRIAQFNGRTATVRAGGTTVTGHVRSVVERKSSIPASWSITLIPTGPKPRIGVLRPVSRIRAFAGDVY
jgi:hypothetical protein